MEKLLFTTEDGQQIEFYVIADTRLSGVSYLLVTDNLEDEEAEAYILKDTSADGDAEGTYEIVEDETLLTALGKVFNEDLEDIDLSM